jgi:hypothetical protein
MAADDDKNEAPDPWADLVADDLAGGGQVDGGEEISFSFGDEAQPSGEPLPEEPVSEEPISEEPISEEPVSEEPAAAVNDDDVGAWLTAMEDDSSDAGAAVGAEADTADVAPPLSVFAPEEGASEPTSQSSIEIGTGFSGIDLSAGDDGSQAEADHGIEAGNADAIETEESTLSFEAAAPVVAGVAATTVAAPRAGTSKPRAKGGGVGPMIGVVAGGVMAIPITMAILLWGFQRDPFGVAKQVPESMAFLLPQKFRPGFKKRAAPSADMPAAPSLDDLAAAPPAPDAPPPDALPPDAGEPVDEVSPPADEPSTALEPEPPAPLEPSLPDAALPATDPLAPAGDAGTEPAVAETDPADPLFPDPDAPAPSTSEPLASEPLASEPLASEPLASEPQPAASSPPVAAVEPPPPAPPPPPPLDIAAFEAALTEAATALEAVAAVQDLSDIAGKKLLVGWYKSLARTGDELVKLENEAADTGRPLEGTRERLAELHAGIAAQDAVAAALPKLARDWLAYARRDSEGILLPVRFNSSKKIGPYWRSKVQLGEGDDARELAIITREEPAAVAGDMLLVTGIVFDGDVIWAADVRSPAAEPATVDF